MSFLPAAADKRLRACAECGVDLFFVFLFLFHCLDIRSCAERGIQCIYFFFLSVLFFFHCLGTSGQELARRGPLIRCVQVKASSCLSVAIKKNDKKKKKKKN